MRRHCLLLLIVLMTTAICGTPRGLPAWPPQRGCRAGDPGRGHRYHVLSVPPAVAGGILPARERRCHDQNTQTETIQAAKIETTYDSSKDRTTVRLAPVQIAGEKDKYHSLHMAPSFSFPGHEPERPSIIDFELQTIVKGRLLDSDLYVVFIVDGETIFLSSNRWGIPRPVPGRRWVGERLVFRMPYEMFVKITKAKKFEMKFDGVKFEVGEPQMQTLRDFATHMD